jgi:hypothetical protein
MTMPASLNMPPRRTKEDFAAPRRMTASEYRFYLSLIFALAALPYVVLGALARWLLGA